MGYPPFSAEDSREFPDRQRRREVPLMSVAHCETSRRGKSVNRPALAALTSLVATSHVLCGSDYPFTDIGVVVTDASALGLSAEARQAIHRDNAVALFQRLKRPDTA
jgi:predicted TIM-barrel fold metal-dependent hydrolase